MNNAAALILDIHGHLLRIACAKLGQHHEGLAKAARVLAQQRLISDSMKKAMLNVDTAAAFVRHITQPKNDMLQDQLKSMLDTRKQDVDDAPMPGETPTTPPEANPVAKVNSSTRHRKAPRGGTATPDAVVQTAAVPQPVPRHATYRPRQLLMRRPAAAAATAGTGGAAQGRSGRGGHLSRAEGDCLGGSDESSHGPAAAATVPAEPATVQAAQALSADMQRSLRILKERTKELGAVSEPALLAALRASNGLVHPARARLLKVSQEEARQSTTLGQTQEVDEPTKVLDIPNEIKVGYSPVGFDRCDCGSSASRNSKIKWEIGVETGGKKMPRGGRRSIGPSDTPPCERRGFAGHDAG